MTTIILASGSQWRKKLLVDIGLNIIAIAAEIEEGDIIGDNPINTAIARAQAKAENVLERYPESMIIGADQVCHFNGETIGKPTSDQEWLDRLEKMRGKKHFLSTAVSIRSSNHSIDFHETTAVKFRKDLPREVLQRYIATNEARYCAGGYMMERKGAWLIEEIEGDWQNVIGLPIFSLTEHLRSIGVDFFGGNDID
jgi:septum formation protein